MLKARFQPYVLNFKEPGGTSRGVMTTRKVWYILIHDSVQPDVIGIGECAPLPGLSVDDMSVYESILQKVCDDISSYVDCPYSISAFPSIRFGLEMAWRDYLRKGTRVLYPSDFTDGNQGITINGLIWMGSPREMMKRISEKLDEGFSCLKLKIGSTGFDDEYDLLKKLRQSFSLRDLELRVDANGAFDFDEALPKLCRLADLQIHSIEQPIKAGQWEKMASLCMLSPIPIALDEELIGIHSKQKRMELIQVINPAYIILKPSLLGGFESSDEWIHLAQEQNVGWWITSALESNIGLNALAQWSYLKNNPLPQGLGTGQVFTNNIPTKLRLAGELLYINPDAKMPGDLNLILTGGSE